MKVGHIRLRRQNQWTYVEKFCEIPAVCHSIAPEKYSEFDEDGRLGVWEYVTTLNWNGVSDLFYNAERLMLGGDS